MERIVVLSGGVGGARFLEGLVTMVNPKNITIICNTGDDHEFYGLHVSPDIDILMYTLAGIVNPTQGWGIDKDTYSTMKQLTAYGNPDWFLLGDRDLATHIHRTNMLRQGKTLSEITKELSKSLGISCKLLPMSNESIQTHIFTARGLIHFEEYFVKYHAEDPVKDIIYIGAERAVPTPGVLTAIVEAKIIILAPSNPLVSIGSILAVPGIKKALQESNAVVAAISPLIANATIKGPADNLMKGMGMEISSVGIARYYADIIDIIILDRKDSSQIRAIEELGIQAFATQTLMKDKRTKAQLAKEVLEVSALTRTSSVNI